MLLKIDTSRKPNLNGYPAKGPAMIAGPFALVPPAAQGVACDLQQIVNKQFESIMLFALKRQGVGVAERERVYSGEI